MNSDTLSVKRQQLIQPQQQPVKASIQSVAVMKKEGMRGSMANPQTSSQTGSLSDLFCPDVTKHVKRAIS